MLLGYSLSSAKEKYMSVIVFVFGMSILLTVIVWAGRNLIRNNKVFKFRQYVNNLMYAYSMRKLQKGEFKSGYDKFQNKLPSYSAMVQSTEPLKLETYFTEEEIKRTTGTLTMLRTRSPYREVKP